MSSHDAETATRAVADFASGVTFGDLPNDVVARARRSVLDALGSAVCGASGEMSSAYRECFLRDSTAVDASVALCAEKTSTYNAALLNATFAHSTELFETYTRAAVHPGGVVVPAVLAVAEQQGCTGAEVVTAVVAGFEVLIRIGLSCGRYLALEQGLYSPAVLGAFGSAAAVSNLLKLDVDATGNALGVAACLLPTALSVAVGDDATVKDLFEGMAAATGVLSCDLAARGLTGPVDGLGHWLQSTPREADPAALVSELGSEWRIASGGLHFKDQAVFAMGQPTLVAIRQMSAQSAIEPAEVSHVLVETSRRSVLGSRHHPQSIVAAKSSIPFIVATALVHQDRLPSDPHFVRTLTADTLTDREIERLTALVEVRVDEEIDYAFEAEWPLKFASRVTIEFAEGRRRTEYVDIWPRTSTFNDADVAAKFKDICHGLLADSEIDEISAACAVLETLPDVRGLAAALRAHNREQDRD